MMETESLNWQIQTGVHAAYELVRPQRSDLSFDERITELATLDIRDGGDRVRMFCAACCQDAVKGVGGDIFELSSQKRAAIMKAHQAFTAIETIKEMAMHDAENS